jgi:hypothetical protein
MREQQPLLTAEEVCKILEGEISEAQRDVFESLMLDICPSGWLTDPDTQIPLLQYCERVLNEKGIFACLKINDDKEYRLVAGAVGWLVSQLDWLETYLQELLCFISEKKALLPPEMVGLQATIYGYLVDIDDLIFTLVSAYAGSDKDDKSGLETCCIEAEDFLQEVDKFLKQWECLCRAHALTTL